MDRVEKVATPATAATVAVPLRVPPPGLVPMATVTLDVVVVTMLLKASSTATVTAGLMAAPAAVFVGCCTKARWVAAAAVMLKAVEVAPVRAVSAAARVERERVVLGKRGEEGAARGRRERVGGQLRGCR